MRILVVAMANSIHTARWLQQFDNDKDVEFVLLPSTLGGLKKELKSWARLYGPLSRFNFFPRSVIQHFPVSKLNTAFHHALDILFGRDWRINWLIKTIKRVKPDIVHSLEFQHAGYTCLAAKQKMKESFPTWIATNWGSDIYLFSQLKSHIDPIKGILEEADFYSAECARDYTLAQNIGMKAKPLPVIPNAGGMDLEKLEYLRNEIPVTKRKLILIKGYQMAFGRALSALRAIEIIADELKRLDVKICFFSVTADIEIAIEVIANSTGLDIEILPIKNYISHEEVLKLHAQSRCYVGLSISDGISTSMLEAMALGSFPIQTCTSCANEWIEDGVSGFIAACGKEENLAKLIMRAVTNDELVESAAAINWRTMKEKASYDDVKKIAKSFYVTAYDEHQKKK